MAPVSWVSGLFERRPFEEGTFEVEGLRLHYERHGEGSRVLVFLHGLLLDNQLSRRLAADLADRGFQVVLLDLPGHGLSDKPRHASAHRMDSYARYVVALLDELGIDEAVVGGVSLGANVSLQVAVQAPDRVRGLLIEMPVLEWAVPGAAIVFLPMLLGVHYAAPVGPTGGVPGAPGASVDRGPPRQRGHDDLAPSPRRSRRCCTACSSVPSPRPTKRAKPSRRPRSSSGTRSTSSTLSPTPITSRASSNTLGSSRPDRSSSSALAPDRLTAEIAEFLDDTWSEGSEPRALGASA